MMKEITSKEFVNLLMSKSVVNLSNYCVVDSEVRFDISKASPSIHISNCRFSYRLLVSDSRNTKEPDVENCLTFHKCTFESVVIGRCNLDELKFTSIESSGVTFSISESQIYKFYIHDSTISNDVFAFHHNSIIHQFDISNLRTNSGAFNLRKNKFLQSDGTFYKQCIIRNCQLFNCDITNNDFGAELFFINNDIAFQHAYSQTYFKIAISLRFHFKKQILGG